MKKILTAIFIVSTFSNCYQRIISPIAGKSVYVSTRIPKISKESETFDLSQFVNKPPEQKVRGKDTIYSVFSLNSLSVSYLHRAILQITKPVGDSSTIMCFDYTNPLFTIIKEFYPQGNIKRKGVQCVFGFRVGKWYFYDQHGKYLETIDFDAGYQFTYNEVFRYCITNKISLKEHADGHTTEIHKWDGTNASKRWVVRFSNFKRRIYETVVLDGVTGNVLSSGEMPFPYD